uniref:Uncharacterized protein n=1 Tax=Glossina pallidipes TaxID=7398 RepID=A0A1A9ZAP3_GLOPL
MDMFKDVEASVKKSSRKKCERRRRKSTDETEAMFLHRFIWTAWEKAPQRSSSQFSNNLIEHFKGNLLILSFIKPVMRYPSPDDDMHDKIASMLAMMVAAATVAAVAAVFDGSVAAAATASALGPLLLLLFLPFLPGDDADDDDDDNNEDIDILKEKKHK